MYKFYGEKATDASWCGAKYGIIKADACLTPILESKYVNKLQAQSFTKPRNKNFRNDLLKVLLGIFCFGQYFSLSLYLLDRIISQSPHTSDYLTKPTITQGPNYCVTSTIDTLAG